MVSRKKKKINEEEKEIKIISSHLRMGLELLMSWIVAQRLSHCANWQYISYWKAT